MMARLHAEMPIEGWRRGSVAIAANAAESSRWAADWAAQRIVATIRQSALCRVVFASGASQIALLSCLCQDPRINWLRVEGFHLDEYLGLSADHPASFRSFLKARVTSQAPIRRFHFIDGEAADPQVECERLGHLISKQPVDVALVGIGENGHLAFNDPPADFDTDAAFLVVTLDEACQQQQVGEGWFRSREEVPNRAITMSIQQIMRSRHIVCCAPEARKASAVAAALQGPVTPRVPASILRHHPDVAIFLDAESASRFVR